MLDPEENSDEQDKLAALYIRQQENQEIMSDHRRGTNRRNTESGPLLARYLRDTEGRCDEVSSSEEAKEFRRRGGGSCPSSRTSSRERRRRRRSDSSLSRATSGRDLSASPNHEPFYPDQIRYLLLSPYQYSQGTDGGQVSTHQTLRASNFVYRLREGPHRVPQLLKAHTYADIPKSTPSSTPTYFLRARSLRELTATREQTS
nr:TPA_asm: hypothetical protein [Moniex tapwovirus]